MSAKTPQSNASAVQSVAAFLRRLEHPHKAGIECLRDLILDADSRITEEVKWNAPSFKMVDHFATFKLYPPKSIQLVLHTGAKAKASPKVFRIDGPTHMLKWPAADRCVLTLDSELELRSHLSDVQHIIRQWIAQL